MVHALEIIHRLLQDDGLLIDIRPTGRPPEIYLRSGEVEHFIGHLEETDDFIEYQQAEEAVQAAIRHGWFSLLERRQFIFNTCASSFEELKTFLESTWSDILFPLPLVSKAEAMETQASGEASTRLQERAWISSLARNWRFRVLT